MVVCSGKIDTTKNNKKRIIYEYIRTSYQEKCFNCQSF